MFSLCHATSHYLLQILIWVYFYSASNSTIDSHSANRIDLISLKLQEKIFIVWSQKLFKASSLDTSVLCSLYLSHPNSCPLLKVPQHCPECSFHLQQLWVLYWHYNTQLSVPSSMATSQILPNRTSCPLLWLSDTLLKCLSFTSLLMCLFLSLCGFLRSGGQTLSPLYLQCID